MVHKESKKEIDTVLSFGKYSAWQRLLRELEKKTNIKLTLSKNSQLERVSLSESFILPPPDTVQAYIWSPLIFEKFKISKSYTVRDTSGGVLKE